MKSLLEISKDYKIERKKTNPRSDLVQMFQVEINKERRQKLPWIAVSQKVSHIKSFANLLDFYNQCLRYRSLKGSFGKCFFGALKIKDDNDKK